MLLNNQQTAGKNQEGNLKISGDKWKCKHNNPKSVRHRKKNSSKRDLQLYKPTSGNKKNLK